MGAFSDRLLLHRVQPPTIMLGCSLRDPGKQELFCVSQFATKAFVSKNWRQWFIVTWRDHTDGVTSLPRRSIMTVCPVAIAVGCRRCPAFSFCPATRLLGDQPESAAPADTVSKKKSPGVKKKS
ncbi:MAG: hypothetical protein CVV15_11665 [Gammaproteobacteria bacterium HGW-Gammaproteobacteria-5]|nr:MAG: hypothetical protein CVV15_11665 [Gammaproteobacteria bacterium HGW-Gammaproteobacteria-5]